MKTRIKKLNEFLKSLQTMSSDFELVDIENYDITKKLNPFQSKRININEFNFWSKKLQSGVFIKLESKNNKYVSYELWELNKKSKNTQILNLLSNVFY